MHSSTVNYGSYNLHPYRKPEHHIASHTANAMQPYPSTPPASTVRKHYRPYVMK